MDLLFKEKLKTLLNKAKLIGVLVKILYFKTLSKNLLKKTSDHVFFYN